MNTELTGADLEEIDREVMEEIVEEIEAEQKEWAKDLKFLPGSRKEGPTRFAFNEQHTLPMERLYVLDEDYRDKRNAGLYPPLAPVHYYVNGEIGPFGDPQEAMMVAGEMGLLTPEMLPSVDPVTGAQIPATMPPPITQKPSFWAVLSGTSVQGLQGLPQFPSGWSLMKQASRDFKNLLETYGRKEEEAMSL